MGCPEDSASEGTHGRVRGTGWVSHDSIWIYGEGAACESPVAHAANPEAVE